MDEQRQPIIIRRRKGKKHKHHGGSWKIALADFMTALMALFLVMWILSMSSEEQRQSISEYFKTPLAVALAGGDKNSASTSPVKGGGDDPVHQKGEQARIDMRQHTRPSDVRRHFADLQQRIQQAVQADPLLKDLQSQLRFDITREGLRIMMLDTESRPMFELGSDVIASYMERLLKTMAPLLNDIPNQITISGHTDSLPYAGGESGYSNWELSTDRAHASRKALLEGGFSSDQLLLVMGAADRIPLENAAPDDPRNRRITLVVHTFESASFIREQGFFPREYSESELNLLPEALSTLTQ
ncbi:Motility protein B [Pseudidiomarina piscicola]|uniref:Motility protein B n=1 Tax=Pseudidiomarina piscicola TaxID=2614830 RepID=A0A6S6WRT6_9GAMM|nr:flagellar motor protein MotB [Pseudidiomarina piscicola]CAB0151068.1 Motility protein B [Pseudidiomarina piscicola]VZT40576.1 Motility protein B [Pseudomonas aeruginosa]